MPDSQRVAGRATGPCPMSYSSPSPGDRAMPGILNPIYVDLYLVHWSPVEMGATTTQSQSRQHHSQPRCDDFGRFQGWRDGEPLFTPRLESTFQHPYFVNAYALQCDGYARAYDIVSRRGIENELDIIRNTDTWRLPQGSGIHSERT